MRLAKDQILLIKTSCTGVFPQEIKRLPGVQGAACANGKAMHHGWNGDSYARSDGTKALLNQASVDLDFFQLFGLQPVSGRFFSRDHDPDPAKTSIDSPSSTPHPVVLNVKAVHELGFRTPKDAVGQLLTQEGASKTFEVIGVAPDYSVDPLHEPVRPFAFDLEPGKYDWLNVKLEGRHLPETLAAIDSLWKRSKAHRTDFLRPTSADIGPGCHTAVRDFLPFRGHRGARRSITSF
jgi:putative ABC transport system permease protein